jgi:hypothetical protein
MIGISKFWIVALILTAGGLPALAQRNAHEIKPVPMQHRPADTNAVRWHTITVKPKPGVPEIHVYDKLNPVWWFGNADDPVPPDWYRPDDKHRQTKWYFRNPLHNFTFYVIGLADKNFHRSGHYPERNSDPHGGWDFDLIRRHILFLPHISYDRKWCNFYFGWRERGNFGIELIFHRKPKPAGTPKTPVRPESREEKPATKTLVK